MADFKLFRRLVSLMLALVVLMSLVTVSASAEEVTEANTYVLERNAITDSVYYHYQSENMVDYTIVENGTPSPHAFHEVFVFNLKNTKGGNGVLAYCTDINATTPIGAGYRRMNLEDSPFSAAAAGKIRRILTNGFYFTAIPSDAAEHKALINNRVAALAAGAEVTGLNASEAIAATQLAIWKAAHGSLLTYDNYCRSISNVTSTFVKYADFCQVPATDDAYKAAAAARIAAVTDYLLSLSPISANEKAVSASAFTSLNEPVFTQNADGTFNATVTTTVNVLMKSGDSLTLTARIGGRSDSVALSSGSQTKTLTVENVPADMIPGDVTLSISGYQTAADYFFFDSLGEREAAQCMVGYTNAQYPVYAEVVAAEERILSFEKTTRAENGRFPLKGIAFDIYPLATMDEYRSGQFVLKENPAADKPKVDFAEYTVITDANGRASLNLTQHGLPDGVYLIVEHSHPSIVAPVAPFYVIVPMTNESGTGLDYQITIKPKNDIKGDVDVEKDVIEVGNNEASVDAAVPHTWIISTTVPHDIGTGESFRITDTLDNRLDYIGNMKVMLETMDSSVAPVELAVNTDYNVTVNEVTTEGKPSDSFVVSLTKAGMSNIAALIGSKSTNYRLRVYFDAQLNANAEVGTDIPNKANVSYTNTFGFTFNDQSDVPVVNTGAANLLKVDGSNNEKVLPGAVFEVYRKATEEELTAGGENLVNIAGVAEKVVKVAFYNNAEMITDEESGKGIVTSVTTDENGKAAIYGLAYGEYYLVETQAPAGYNLLANATKITIDKTSHTEEMVVKIENKAGVVLPQTGGMGTTLFTASGLLLVGVACIIFMSKRKGYAR